MDKLTIETMLAKKANMSYGKWKALQKPVPIPKKEVKDDGMKECAWCGKKFKPTSSKQRFCGVYCQQTAYNTNHRKRLYEIKKENMKRKALAGE